MEADIMKLYIHLALVLLVVLGCAYFLYKRTPTTINTNKGVFLVGTTYDDGVTPANTTTRLVVVIGGGNHKLFVVDAYYQTAKVYSKENKLLATYDNGNIVFWNGTAEVESVLVEIRRQLNNGEGRPVEEALKILDRIDGRAQEMKTWQQKVY